MPDIDLEEFFGLDEAFHRGLLHLGGHASAWSTLASAKGHLDRARRLGLHDTDSPQVFADQHPEILRALLDADLGERSLMLTRPPPTFHGTRDNLPDTSDTPPGEC